MADAILPDGVAAACRDVAGNVDELFSEEREAVAHAIGRRQAEFAAGRSAARAALLQLGQQALPIPAAADRAPIWPSGFTGSISHCRSAVIAVAARLDHTHRHIGVDVEEAEGLEPELWESICRPDELTWLDGQADAAIRAKIIFSIKEAVYKAQFPLTREMIDFHDVEIAELDAGGRFAARLLNGDAGEVTGRFWAGEQFILALAMARAPAR